MLVLPELLLKRDWMISDWLKQSVSKTSWEWIALMFVDSEKEGKTKFSLGAIRKKESFLLNL